jgi:hypothetical protein
MAPQVELQTLLEELLESNRVYFQPPPNLSMAYPCIVYQRDAMRTDFADNAPYSIKQRYQLTVIDRNVDSAIIDRVKQLPECLYNRFFVADNLNHDVFTIYF